MVYLKNKLGGKVKKYILILLITVAPVVIMAAQSRNIEILDVPTANTLIKGELRGDFKFIQAAGF